MNSLIRLHLIPQEFLYIRLVPTAFIVATSDMVGMVWDVVLLISSEDLQL